MSAIDDVIDRSMHDEEFRAELRENPDTVLNEYDLTEEEEAAIRDGLEAEVSELASGEGDLTVFST
ncbi:MAG: Os1348 family NHLP clan protein [Halobaculum sp.]